MLKYIIFILVFNILCSAENFDIFKNSDHKPADNAREKRQLPAESKDVIIKNPHEQPQNVASTRQGNTDSVKKDLTNKEHSESVAVSSQNAGTANKNDDQNAKTAKTSKEDSKDKEKPTVSNTTSISQDESEKIETVNVSGTHESKNNSTISKPKIKNIKHAATEHPGAALRGFYVFLGLSVLILIYFLFKAFRLRPGAPPPATVRKYGVVGRRSDMEMLPLPLAEEDDDDTLFDMGTQIHR